MWVGFGTFWPPVPDNSLALLQPEVTQEFSCMPKASGVFPFPTVRLGTLIYNLVFTDQWKCIEPVARNHKIYCSYSLCRFQNRAALSYFDFKNYFCYVYHFHYCCYILSSNCTRTEAVTAEVPAGARVCETPQFCWKPSMLQHDKTAQMALGRPIPCRNLWQRAPGRSAQGIPLLPCNAGSWSDR